MEEKASNPEFWNDMEKAQEVLKQTKRLKNKVDGFNGLKNDFEDLMTLVEMGIEEQEETLIPEARKVFKEFTAKYDDMRGALLLSGEYDANNAILTLHAGAGGTESCDWASMLFRMYTRWAEKRGFDVEILDYLAGEEAGVKSVTIMVSGENAYGYLLSEKGVHRLVRISPFNAAGKRQTSFVSCDVMPELDDSIEIGIKPEDLRVDTYRSSGAGGQHVNKTESAIRITHLPTGVVVQCQNERSQHKNRDRAMKVLKGRLLELAQGEQLDKLNDVRGEVKEIGWSSQIRSYVFQPYSMVKDHRTNEETGNVAAVMDGSLDAFMNAFLVWRATGIKSNDNDSDVE